MTKQLVVCGTNTDVGKTHVGVLLLNALRSAGFQVAASKPLESGVPGYPDSPAPLDASALREAAGAHQRLAQVCPFPLPEPKTPAEELERLKSPLAPEDLRDAVERSMSLDTDLVWVETAGGVRSPLIGTFCSGDLGAFLGAPVLLVAEDTLGTLSLCSTAVEMLKLTGVELFGVVLNRRPNEVGPSFEEHKKWLTRLHPELRVFGLTHENKVEESKLFEALTEFIQS